MKEGVCVQSGFGTNNWYNNECQRDSYDRCKCSSNKDCLNLFTCQSGSCRDATKQFICERKGGKWGQSDKQCTCPTGWWYDWDGCVQACASNSQTRHTNGRCKCDKQGNKCQSQHGQHCINNQCMVPTKKWLCEKNSGAFNAPIKRKSNLQQKATQYYAYPMKGGSGGLTAGPQITEDQAMASAHYCRENVAKLIGCSSKFVSINPSDGNCMCVNEAKKTTAYKSRPVVKNEGKHLLTYRGSVLECENKCDITSGCNSFARCKSGDCWMKNKDLRSIDTEASTSSTHNLNTRKCKTHYKSEEEDTWEFQTTDKGCACLPGWWLSNEGICYQQCSNNNQQRNEDGECICNKGGHNDKCHSSFECVNNGCVNKKHTVCIEAKLKSFGKLDIAPGFSGPADLCDTCYDYIGPNPQTPGDGKCYGDRKGHHVNGNQNCNNYKNGGNCNAGWYRDVCKRMCNHCQPKKFKACAICDPCRDYIGPDANTPGDGKCFGDRKGHATNGGNHCTGYKNNGWCHGDGGTQKWVRSVCPRTCGLCKSAASASADFDSLAVNLDENGNYEKPCCGDYSQCCSGIVSGGVASQSTTLNNDVNNYGAQKARDGNADSMTHSEDKKHDIDPWWKLKFDSPKKIEYVSMRTRIDCCGERLNGAQVEVLTADNNWVKCGRPVSGAQNGKVYTKDCPKNLRVMEVRITKLGKNVILTLVNVEVGGKPDQNEQTKCKAKRLKNQVSKVCKKAICLEEVELFQHYKFQGWKASFPKGTYDNAAAQKRGMVNDDASSIKVPSGCRAVLWQHNPGGGWRKEIGPGEWGGHQFPDNDVSSIQVYDE